MPISYNFTGMKECNSKFIYNYLPEINYFVKIKFFQAQKNIFCVAKWLIPYSGH